MRPTRLLAAFAAAAWGCAGAGLGPASPYEALLSDPRIAAALVWDGPEGPLPYPSWNPERKAALAAALEAKDHGRPAGLSAPPEPVPVREVEKGEPEGFVSGEDAWRLYLAHAAHSLWLERRRKVPWSLLEMSPAERALLLDSRRLMVRQPDGAYRFFRFVLGHAISWEPEIAYRFFKENGMLRPTQRATVLELVRWSNRNLRHAMGNQRLDRLYGYDGPPPADRVLHPLRPGPRWVMGCWGVTGFFAGALRGANVPVESSINGYHSRPFFPGAGLYLYHGDDVYTAQVGPSGSVVPPERIVMAREEFERLVESPELDCADGRCNTAEEQAAYNLSRRAWALALEYMTDYPMSQYAGQGPEYLDGSLRGPRSGDTIRMYAKPLFSDEERKAAIEKVEAELRRIGGGDIEKGGRIVRERSLAFYAIPDDLF